MAARRQHDGARHEGRPRHLARLRRAVCRAHPHAGGRTPAPDRRDDRRPGLREPPRRRARARRQRAVRSGAALDLCQQRRRLRSQQRRRLVHADRCRRSGLRRPECGPHRRRFPPFPLRRSRRPHVRADSGRIPAQLCAPLHAARRAGERLARGHRARPRATGADDQSPVRLLRRVRRGRNSPTGSYTPSA